jgi:protein-disulfide isomerase
MSNLHVIALSIVGVFGVAACTQDNSAIERKLDKLSQQVASLEQKMGGARGGAAGAAQQQQRPKRPEPDAKDVFAVPIAGLPFVGPADAPVTVVEGYEYACPACNAARQTVAMTREKYGDKVRVVYKPYIVHPDVATDASLGVCAAHLQGKFAAMDKLIWDKAFGGRDFSAQKVEALAAEAGLDMKKFKADITGACRESVQRDHGELRSFGQGATPTFYVNGRYVLGASPDKLHAVIDQELALAEQRIKSGTKSVDYYQTWILGKGLKRFEPKPQS